MNQSSYPFLRLVVASCLTVVMVSCSPGGKPAGSGAFLKRQSEALENSTIPADSSNVKRTGILEDNWSQRISWEFDCPLSRTQYVDWVTRRLENDFKLAKSLEETLSFAKNFNGDTETVTIQFTGGRELLHVHVELSLVPD